LAIATALAVVTLLVGWLIFTAPVSVPGTPRLERFPFVMWPAFAGRRQTEAADY
jgi:hypothetical protein